MNEYTELLKDELLLLQRAKIAILKTKLNAGLLLVPEGLQCWNSETEEEPDLSFSEELMNALADEQSRIETTMLFLPFIIRGPVELIREVRHLKLDRSDSLDSIQTRMDEIEERLGRLVTHPEL